MTRSPARRLDLLLPAVLLAASPAGCSRTTGGQGLPTSTAFPTQSSTPSPVPPPEVCVQAQVSPYALAVGADDLFWSNEGDLTVYRRAKAGGTPQALLVTGDPVHALAIDASYLYAGQEGIAPSVALWKVPRSGGTPTAIAVTAPVAAVAADGSRVYWTERGTGNVRSVAASGGTPEAVAGAQDQPSGISQDLAYVYWINQSPGAVRRAPKSGGPVEFLVGGLCGPWGGEPAGGWFYFAEENCGRICRVPAAGGMVQILGQALVLPRYCVSDGTYAYWAEAAGGSVGRYPAPGQPGGVTYATAQLEPWMLALDATHLYWTERGGGKIWRQAR